MNISFPIRSKSSEILMFSTLLLGLIILVIVALWQLNPPAVVPASAPAAEFSAERAMTDLAVIAKEPHPTGSAALLQVESYLVDQFKQMGLEPELQVTTAVQVKDEFESVWAGEVRNIIVRIPGTDSTKPIVLSAHYDAAATSLGASDCGSCVVTVLETARALKAGAPLKNDVILVLNNAEEHEMMGSNAFVTMNPWAQNIGLTLNFEAQGSRGPAFIYVSSRNNNWLIGEVAQASPHPLGYSFLNNLIGVLTERAGSDLEEFMAVGSSGLGYVYTGNTLAYHTRLDSVQNVDPRSIQQEGSNTLALVRHFGNLDLNQPQSGDAAFFNILPGVMIAYPASLAVPLSGLVGLVFIGILAFGFQRKQLTIGGLLLGFVAAILSLLGTLIVVSLAWWAMRTLNSNFHVLLAGNYQSDLYVLGLVLLTLATVSGISALFRARRDVRDLAAGSLLLTVLLMALTSFAMPVGSYLFTWTLLASSLGLAWWLMRDQSALTWEKVAVLLLTALPCLALFVPLTYMFIPLINRAEIFSPIPLMGVPMALIALLMGLLLLQLEALSARGKWTVPAGALGFAVVAWIIAALTSGFSASRPRPDMIAYQFDADTGKSAWYSVDQNLDGYTSQFFSNGSERSTLAAMPSEGPLSMWLAWKAPAPDAMLSAPVVELIEASTNDEGVTYRLYIQSIRQALNMEVRVQSQGEIVSGTVNNKGFELKSFPTESRNLLRLQYYGVPSEGFDFVVTTQSRLSIVVTVEDRSYGLPTLPGYEMTRPDSYMPAFHELSDATLVKKTFQFQVAPPIPDGN